MEGLGLGLEERDRGAGEGRVGRMKKGAKVEEGGEANGYSLRRDGCFVLAIGF